MKNLRLVLTLVLILVSVAIVQAQEEEDEGILQVILRLIFEGLDLDRWICQLFYGKDCPEVDMKVSRLAIFLMIGVLTYDILWTVSPLDRWVCFVFGFALAVICANTPVVDSLIDIFTKAIGPIKGAEVIILLLVGSFVFFGFWITGKFFGAVYRGKMMARAKRIGVERAFPIRTLQEMARAAIGR